MLRRRGGGGQVIEPQEKKEEWKMQRDGERPRRPQSVLKTRGQNLDDNCVSQAEGRLNAHSQMGVFLYQCNTNTFFLNYGYVCTESR